MGEIFYKTIPVTLYKKRGRSKFQELETNPFVFEQ